MVTSVYVASHNFKRHYIANPNDRYLYAMKCWSNVPRFDVQKSFIYEIKSNVYEVIGNEVNANVLLNKEYYTDHILDTTCPRCCWKFVVPRNPGIFSRNAVTF